jgi:hypothetical protein
VFRLVSPSKAASLIEMPLPTLVFVAFGVGVAAALLAGSELRESPRHAVLTSSFKAYALFLTLVVLPASIYFYVFHGDWFLLYSFDVRRIPSAVALMGFVAQTALGVAGFSMGSMLARTQRTTLGFIVALTSAIAAISVVILCRDRLAVVGTFAQYRGDFGLSSYGGPLMQASLIMTSALIYGAAYLLVRIRITSKNM